MKTVYFVSGKRLEIKDEWAILLLERIDKGTSSQYQTFYEGDKLLFSVNLRHITHIA